MGCKMSVKAVPKTWVIVDDDGEADFNAIQDAINNATSGDTIFVRMGIYYEHVIINKSISLVGEDSGSTIVDGNRTGNVISILTANNVIIEGLMMQRSGTNPDNYGIFVSHSSDNNISHNIITNNYNGIGFQSSGNNVVLGNIITSNYDGITLLASTNNVFSGNTISSNNYNGVSLTASINNVVLGNIITSNYDGIALYAFSINNVFSGNTISYNNLGMYFTLYSGNNIIHFNNFNNTHQVGSDSINVWDDIEGGNYWSDYLGHDLNADGIGENPHVIDENNRDNHPLMGLFSAFNIVLERETYHVTTICNSTISEFRFEIGKETGNKIIRFNVTDRNGAVGFCRVTIPTELMNYPFIVIVDGEEISPTFLDTANETLYFTYILSNRTITIISSKVQHLYHELLDEYKKLQIDLYNLNATYYDLLNNYGLLLSNYSSLQNSYYELNTSYLEHLLDYSKNIHNIRNLMYIFASTTAIFIITTIYLSKSAHERKIRTPISASES